MYNSDQKLRDALLADGERCVMCGLCLPQCPTFHIKHNEADSPRGRIVLTIALAKQQLEADDNARGHIESCLHCLHCERICPAQVQFGKLMDNAKYFLSKYDQTTPLPFWLRLLTASRMLRRLLALCISGYRRWGLQSWLRRWAFFKRSSLAAWDAMLPAYPDMPTTRRTMAHRASKTVALFAGCVATLSDQDTLTAAAQLLIAAGFTVQATRRQGCCGALHQHSGHLTQAQVLMRRNIKAFKEAIPVVSCASGCGARLQQYEGNWATNHHDIHAFLLKHAHRLQFRALSESVALHTPCSMCNALKQQDAPKQLLKLIPKLHLISLEAKAGCCGAAGIQLLHHPTQANALADGIIDAMQQTATHTLLTSNVGCAMHLRRRIYLRSLNYRVMHPVLLLYKQLHATQQ